MSWLSDKTFGTAPQLVTAADFPKAARGNYRPSATSACVDNGTTNCWADLTDVVDFDGRPRLQHKKIDIGAYETSAAGFTLIVR